MVKGSSNQPGTTKLGKRHCRAVTSGLRNSKFPIGSPSETKYACPAGALLQKSSSLRFVHSFFVTRTIASQKFSMCNHSTVALPMQARNNPESIWRRILGRWRCSPSPYIAAGRIAQVASLRVFAARTICSATDLDALYLSVCASTGNLYYSQDKNGRIPLQL